MMSSDALARYLETARPGMGFAPERLEVDIPGWTFFRAARPEGRHSGDEFFVVKADGTMVSQAQRADELARVLAAIEMKGDPVQAAWAVLALTTHEEVLIDADAVADLGAEAGSEAVETPKWQSRDGGAVLVLWSKRQDRRGALLRRVVGLRDGRVRVETEMLSDRAQR